MQFIREATKDEIETYLKSLGGGNHTDNMKQLGGEISLCLFLLDESEFMSLVFLSNTSIKKLMETNSNRKLGEIARVAINSKMEKLGANWNLKKVYEKTEQFLQISETNELPPILLRDARGSECKHGDWYLQDGSHRALGYAMAIHKDLTNYTHQYAYIATNRNDLNPS